MDSQAKIAEAMTRAFVRCGRHAPETQAVHQVIGLSLERAIFELDPALPSAVRGQISVAYRQAFADSATQSALYPNAKHVLGECLKNNFTLAIATGKSLQGLNAALEALDLGQYFSVIRTADQCASKPAPQMIEEILMETMIKPEQAIVVGDTTHDLQMAANAGVAAVAACYGAHKREALAEHEPLFYLDTIADLISLLPCLLGDEL